MTTKNDITGDEIRTGTPSQAYRDNYDKIFNKPTEEPQDNDTKDTDENILELQPCRPAGAPQ